ncbi:hypothetical protein KW791_00215 [Candidatus Parcubacteria bacterium]|nr:hypothetical protein [Candidatus Parcubacteria bacterium]
MSEDNAAVQEQPQEPAPAPAPAPEVDQAVNQDAQDYMQIFKIKQEVRQQLAKLYNKFMECVKAMPAQENARVEALRHFDTGFLWMDKAIEIAPLNVEKKKAEPLNEVPPQQENASENQPEKAEGKPEDNVQPS